MTETEFDNGYWYANDLKKFAEQVGSLRRGACERASWSRRLSISCVLGAATSFARRTLTKSGPRDVDLGLRFDLPVVHYASNRQTKDFIELEGAKLEPGF
jgi:hypothetical protein